MRRVINTLFCAAFLLSGCGGGKSLEPAAYVRWMEQPGHDFRKEVESGGWQYTIQLATPAFMTAKELSGNGAKQAAWQQRMQELKGHLFFIVQVGRTEAIRKGNPLATAAEVRQRVNQMVEYYDQQAMADISLRVGQRELKPVVYHFENNYELSPYNTIIAGFETGTPEGDLIFTFNDQFTAQPLIHAGYNLAALAGAPVLQLQP